MSLTTAQRDTLARHDITEFGTMPNGQEVVKVTCPRCLGSGHYSRCQMYGTRCFNCNVATGGKLIGYVWEPAERVAKRLRRNELAAAKAERAREAARAIDARIAVTLDELISTVAACKASQLATQAAAMPHVGKIGQKWTGSVIVVCSIQLGSHPVYGSRWLNKLRHGQSELVWFTSRPIEADNGEAVTISAEIKEHSEYNGLPQTILSRVKVIES